MPNTIDSTSPLSNVGNPSHRSVGALSMTGWLFAPLVILLLAFLILVQILLVVALTYSGSEVLSTSRLFDRGWVLLSGLAAAWALINLIWSRQAERAADSKSRYGHLAIVIGCGLIVLGIHAVLFARNISSQHVIMDYSQAMSQSGAGAAGPTATLAEGDSEEGQKIFSTTCITCHGPTGGGMPNLAPSLRGSAFIASADDAAIANVIRLGRAVGTPDNKTGKVMPARGGNPFLGDDKIVHLVAFVRAIQSDGGGLSREVDQGLAPPTVQLAKWVVPQGPLPPVGLLQLDSLPGFGNDPVLVSKSENRRTDLFRNITLGLTGVHGLFLMIVMVVSSHALFRGILGDSALKDRLSSESLLVPGWSIALFAWLIVLLLGFVWL